MTMTDFETLEPKRRNRNFEDTHRLLIEKAVELISESGAEAVSVSALARATRINRSTVYYHFDSRDALIAAVRKWSSEELAKGVSPDAARRVGIDHISSFVLRNPEIIKLWIDDYIAPGDIRQRYPQWDSLVAQIAESFAESAPDDDPCDAEVYCVLMLTSAFIAPRVFKNSVHPQESLERIVERFSREQHRMILREGIRAPRTLNGGSHIQLGSSGAGERDGLAGQL
jgi:AcrR family transcriptional regulator